MSEPVSSDAAAPEVSGRPVLVVVADEKDRRWVVQTLQRHGHAAEAVGSGTEAIAAFQRRPFAAAVLDLFLADMGSWDVLRELRASAPDQPLPALMVAGSPLLGSFSGFMVSEFLSKPPQPGEVLAGLTRSGVLPSGKNSILIVDSQATHLDLLGNTLKQLGFKVIAKSSADAALESSVAEPAAALILDPLLADSAGYVLVDRLRATTRGRPLPLLICLPRTLSDQERAILRTWGHLLTPWPEPNLLMAELWPRLREQKALALNAPRS